MPADASLAGETTGLLPRLRHPITLGSEKDSERFSSLTAPAPSLAAFCSPARMTRTHVILANDMLPGVPSLSVDPETAQSIS